MRLRIVNGKNYKNFIKVEDLTTKKDFELYESLVKNVLSRTEFMPFLKSFNKNITYSYAFQEYYFPIQFIQDIDKYLRSISPVPIEIIGLEKLVDPRITREKFDNWLWNLKFPEKFDTNSEEYDYQRDSAFLALKYRMGRVEIGTSGGKTFITYLYLKYIIDHKLFDRLPPTNGNTIGDEKRSLVIVPTKLLAQQLKNDFNEYQSEMPDSERKLSVESIYAGSKKLLFADVVCGTFQSLCNYEKEYFDDFGCIICDELHRAKTYTIRTEIFAKAYNCEYWFGMTGTEPEYKTLDYLHIVSMFGPQLLKIEAHELIERGVATAIQIEVINIQYKEHADFAKEVHKSGLRGLDKSILEKEFFHSYEPRNLLLAKLLNALPDNSIILVNKVEYVHFLYDFLSSRCPEWQFEKVHGTHDTYKLDRPREEIIQEIKTVEKNYCIIGTYKTMSTGISINNLFNCYLPDGGKSKTNIGQTIGRLMRLFSSKIVGKLFDFQDDMMMSNFREHAKERNKYYRAKKFPRNITNVKI